MFRALQIHACNGDTEITLVGPGSDSLAPGLVEVRTGRLSPADKGVNMKLTGGPLGEGAVNFNEGRNSIRVE